MNTQTNPAPQAEIDFAEEIRNMERYAANKWLHSRIDDDTNYKAEWLRSFADKIRADERSRLVPVMDYPKDSDEPFSEAWKKEMMKWNKTQLIDFLRDVLKEKDSLVTSQAGQGWISVKDKLPETFNTVIFVNMEDEHPQSESGYYNDRTNAFTCHDDYDYKGTHWMPLPEPPLTSLRVKESNVSAWEIEEVRVKESEGTK